MRQGSAPNFAPPVEEGIVFPMEDENGDIVNLEFLGLIVHDDARFGFFFPVDDEHPACSSGEIVIFEVESLDDEGQPEDFELVTDEAVALDLYKEFQEATKDLYDFE